MPHTNPRVLAIGETMALVTPISAEALETAEIFQLGAGGAESNVAVHLAHLGHHAAWASHLGDDALGHRVERQLRDRGVDTSFVRFDPSAPTGVYFKDPGHGVSYYRSGSAASRMTRDAMRQLPLEGAQIVHLSGITPALSAECADLVDSIFERVQQAAATLSFDVNYRAGLWPVAEAAPVLLALARRADFVFVGLDEANTLWGCDTADDVRHLIEEPLRLIVKDGDVGATEFSEEGRVFVPAQAVTVVEVVGAGDAFAAGYLSAHLAPHRDADLSAPSSLRRLNGGHDRAVLALQSTSDLPERLIEHPTALRKEL